MNGSGKGFETISRFSRSPKIRIDVFANINRSSSSGASKGTGKCYLARSYRPRSSRKLRLTSVRGRLLLFPTILMSPLCKEGDTYTRDKYEVFRNYDNNLDPIRTGSPSTSTYSETLFLLEKDISARDVGVRINNRSARRS